jgi:peptidoglycan/xylan/chitin deacetylase (PgdA/CDA1 family)
MKRFVKQASKQLLNVLPRFSDYSAILMLHRVGVRDSKRISANQNMVICPKELDVFITDSKKNGWSFISLDELAESVKKKRVINKTVILTFDDGYLDNLTEATPVLSNHKVPFTVYVTTSFVGSREVPWWYKLETILASADEVTLPDRRIFDVKSIEEQQDTFLKIRNQLMASGEVYALYQDWLNENYKEPSVESGHLFMSWKELKKLAALPLVTIGAHTHKHTVLSRSDESDAFEDIRISKEILEKQLEKEVRHFAYPFGGRAEAADREFQQAQEIGFETAVTTRVGAINTSEMNLFSLPRCFYEPTLTLELLQRRLFENEVKNKIKRLLVID